MNEAMNYSDEECRDFTGRMMQLGADLYQYMHGEWLEPEEPKTILKRLLRFFEGDWIGLIDFDIDMGIWSAKHSYNAHTESTTDMLIGEADKMWLPDRWINAIHKGNPVIIRNIQDIREAEPKEYDMYKHLKIRSILGVPYRNCGSGLLVVRNPRKFSDNYVMLNLMAYMATNEIIACRRKKNIERRAVKYIPTNEKEIKINLFGDFEITGKNLHMVSKDLTKPMEFMIAYLCCHKDKYVSLDRLSDLYMDENIGWKNQIYRFRKAWKDFEGHEDDENQLIVTTEKGYRLNPDLNIVVDTDCVMDMVKAIEDQTDLTSKIDMLEKFLALYRGLFLEGHPDNEMFVVEKRMKYKAIFNEKMEELLKLLYGQEKYNSLVGYSADILEICPDCVGIYSWRAAAFSALGRGELANNTLDNAHQMLEPREYKTLCSRYLKTINTTHFNMTGIGMAKCELIAKDGKLLPQNIAPFTESDQLYG